MSHRAIELKLTTTVKLEITEGRFDVDCGVERLCFYHRSCCNWPSGAESASVLAADGVDVLALIHGPELMFNT